MGYALFAQRKLVLDSQLNYCELMQTQRSNEQYQLATNTLSLQQKLASNNASQAGELAEMYNDLSTNAQNDADREEINAQIKAREEDFERENDAINQEIYVVSAKENAIEMEIKRLDTMVTALQKQLEAVEEAEGDAIDRATPKYNGV